MVDLDAFKRALAEWQCAWTTLKSEQVSLRRAIEAYEAALWRPIEEAPRDGTKICVWWAEGKGPISDYPECMEFLWWERDCWISDLGGRALTHSGCVDVGAMFRTIDPPKQNAAQGAGEAHQEAKEDKSSAM